MSDSPADPLNGSGADLAGFRIGIEIGGEVAGWFTEIGALTIEREVTEHHEGGVNDHIHYLAGPVGRSNITLRHGIAGDELWQWFEKGLFDVAVERRDITLLLFPPGGGEPKRWSVLDAFPVKWSGVEFKAGAGDVLVEELVLGQGQPAGAAGGESSEPETKPREIDHAKLAEKVYELLRQDLKLDLERRGRTAVC